MMVVRCASCKGDGREYIKDVNDKPVNTPNVCPVCNGIGLMEWSFSEHKAKKILNSE